MATTRKLAVVVAQSGADVDSCVASLGRDVAVELLQQGETESPAQLTSRLRARLAELAGTGERVGSVSFVARSGFSVADVMAVAGLLRNMVASVVALGAAHVYVHAEARDVHTRYALTALVDALSEQLQDTDVEFHCDSLDVTPARRRARPGGSSKALAP